MFTYYLKTYLEAIGFLLTFIFLTLLWWVAGFDFFIDGSLNRSLNLAMWWFISCIVGVIVVWILYEVKHE